MKRTLVIPAALLMFAVPAFAEMEHTQGHEGHMQQEQQMAMPGGMEMHAMEIDGFKVDFHIMDRKAFRKYMDDMGHTSHEMKEGMSHYVMLDITDPSGKKIHRAQVKIKVIDPKEKAEEKVGFPMMGSFGAEFDMPAKGKYQIMTLFKIKEEKHQGGFSHEMK